MDDEILYRLHSLSFNSKKLIDAIASNSNPKASLNNNSDIYQLIASKRCYLGEIEEAYRQKM